MSVQKVHATLARSNIQKYVQKFSSRSRLSSEFARLHFQNSSELQIFHVQNSTRSWFMSMFIQPELLFQSRPRRDTKVPRQQLVVKTVP